MTKYIYAYVDIGKNYLNNPHHNELLSGGRRHMASVTGGGIGQFADFEKGKPYRSMRADNKVFDILVKVIESIPRRWYQRRNNSVVLGNYKYTYEPNYGIDHRPAILITPKDAKNKRDYQAAIHSDGSFLDWVMWHYDFSGFGEHTVKIDQIVLEMFHLGIMLCLDTFHDNTKDKTGYYSPEVYARQISFGFWSLITMRAAYIYGSYGNLPVYNWGRNNSSTMVLKFEEICNKWNDTDYHYAGQWYNNATDKREQDAAVDLYRSVFRL